MRGYLAYAVIALYNAKQLVFTTMQPWCPSFITELTNLILSKLIEVKAVW